MDHDFMKRGYLLPEGCKDMMDVLKLKQQPAPKLESQPPPAPLPPIIGEIVIPEQTSVLQLAALLSQQPFRIVADVMRLGVFVTIEQVIDFEIIFSIARKYGYIAKRAT